MGIQARATLHFHKKLVPKEVQATFFIITIVSYQHRYCVGWKGLETTDGVDSAFQKLYVIFPSVDQHSGLRITRPTGSIPARRRSCCTQSHSINTSPKPASHTDLRSAERRRRAVRAPH